MIFMQVFRIRKSEMKWIIPSESSFRGDDIRGVVMLVVLKSKYHSVFYGICILSEHGDDIFCGEGYLIFSFKVLNNSAFMHHEKSVSEGECMIHIMGDH